jgi:YidC/Oxa1 family membrane protein insertase
MLFASSPFDPFFKLFASVLAFFYAITNNYALAIIMLTLLVMIIVTPLTLKGTRSMMMMQQLQPEMKKIQARYKDDRQKLNEELLKFYKENNINPLGGCLPLLVQMPVFLVLYQVLRGLTRRVSDLGSGTGWMAGQFPGGTISKPPSLVRVFDPAWISPSTKMYQNLSVSTSMEAFGMDLAESASKALQQGLLHASPYLLLIVIVAITGFLQQRQIQGRNPNAQVNPQQQMIMKIMPIFLPVISFGLPAGLVLYFAVSNMYRIGQQAFISHSIYGGKANGMTWKDMIGLGKGPAPAKKPATSSKDKAKGKAIPASSKELAKGRSQAKAPAKAGASKGGRPAPAKTSSRSSKAGQTSSSTKAPAEATSDSSAAEAPSPAPAKPSSGSTPSGGDAGGGGSTMQPRARKKKR